MSERNRVLARACTPVGSLFGMTGGVLFSPLKTRSWSRNGARGASVDESSNDEPSATGVQFFIMIPLGVYTVPKRFTGAAAVLAAEVSAGIMQSSSGNDRVAPRPRKMVRRSIA